MKPIFVSLLALVALTLTSLAGDLRQVGPTYSSSYTSTTSTTRYVSAGPSWQAGNCDQPIAASRIARPPRESHTVVDLGFFRWEKHKGGSVAYGVHPNGTVVSEVTRYSTTSKETRPMQVYPTTSYGGFIGIQPSYIDNRSRSGGGFGSSSVTVTHTSPYRALGR